MPGQKPPQLADVASDSSRRQISRPDIPAFDRQKRRLGTAFARKTRIVVSETKNDRKGGNAGSGIRDEILPAGSKPY